MRRDCRGSSSSSEISLVSLEEGRRTASMKAFEAVVFVMLFLHSRKNLKTSFTGGDCKSLSLHAFPFRLSPFPFADH